MVTEKIQVNVDGKNIKRGIYRDFPLTSPFHNYLVPFEVTHAERNGESIEYRLKERGNEVRIKLYEDDVYLDPGTYEYTLTYQTDKQLDFDQSRLFWNVTGEAWAFPIEASSATVVLPNTVPIDNITLNAFTGKKARRKAAIEVHAQKREPFDLSQLVPLKKAKASPSL